MLDRDRNELHERYRKRWEQFGYDSRTLGWNKDCQWVRFDAAFEGLRDQDFKSVLDVGCGFGDLLGYLRSNGWRGRYTGIDVVDELVAEARRRYSSDLTAEFVCGDIAGFHGPHRADLAVAIGVFNHRLNQDNLEFITETIHKMWTATAKVVVCDFLSTSSEVERRDRDLYYADPARLYQLASGYSRRVMIHHAYMPFEFQVKIWHDDSFEQSAPVFAPYARLASAQTEWRKRCDAER